MTATLVCDALSMALFRRGFPEQVIVHSDRGSQYYSKNYRDIINTYNLEQSMSRKGNCWDNACVESFFHPLKVEAIQYEPIMTRDEMRQTIFEYIEVDYNRTRRHSALGYLSPVNFENKTNYFHALGKPLHDGLAKGLWVFLNSSLVDKYFRQMNGHTQVHATDLRTLRYPTREQLINMGKLLILKSLIKNV